MSTIENMKKSSSTAKRLFTRSNNTLVDAIKLDDEPELVERKIQDLMKRYSEVQDIHENYISEIENDADFDDSKEEEWMSTVAETFIQTERMALGYMKATKKGETSMKSEEKLLPSATNTMMESEKLCNLREFEKMELLHEARTAKKFMDESSIDLQTKNRILKHRCESLEKQLSRCKNAQAQYLSSISKEEAKKELSWTDEVYEIYADVSTELATRMQNDENTTNLSVDTYSQEIQQKMFRLKLQPMPLPKFHGDIREYPRFKDDFKTQVLPSILETRQSYVLKSCLTGVPLEVVKNVDHSITEMWKRLDDKYAEPSKIIDVIMNDIKSMPSIRENDNPKFIQLVDIVERAFRDLERLQLDREVSNASTVSLIEEKLPISIRMKWAEKVKCAIGLTTNKFPHLLQFLIEHKSVIEYAVSSLRCPEQDASANVCYVENSPVTREQTQKIGKITERNHVIPGNSEKVQEKSPNMQVQNDKNQERGSDRFACLLHNSESHNTSDCRVFQQLSVDERIKLIKETYACWCYLRTGHKSAYC